MSTLTLIEPVHALDNRLLLPAGTVLSAETLDALIFSNRTTSDQACPLLQYGSVKKTSLICSTTSLLGNRHRSKANCESDKLHGERSRPPSRLTIVGLFQAA
jgi:hypothetical protein